MEAGQKRDREDIGKRKALQSGCPRLPQSSSLGNWSIGASNTDVNA